VEEAGSLVDGCRQQAVEDAVAAIGIA